MNNNFDLRKYIKTVYELEKSLYTQECLRDKLQYDIRTYERDKMIVEEYNKPENMNFRITDPIVESANSFLRSQTSYNRIKSLVYKPSLSINYDSEAFAVFSSISVVTFVISFAISMAIRGNVRLLSSAFWTALFDSFVTGIKFGVSAFVILSLIYLVKGVCKFIKRNREIDEENALIHIENKKIIENNNALYHERQICKSNMQKELDYLNGVSIRETREILNKYYSLNIVYPKYRNLTAISSFNEYLESGRCTALTGHEGAYNIYEEEVRLDRILVKLDVIIEKLEEIKHNQRMLYMAVREAQNTSKLILSEIKSIKDQNMEILNNTGIAAQNSHTIAYNTQISAQNTEFLKWYQVYGN